MAHLPFSYGRVFTPFTTVHTVNVLHVSNVNEVVSQGKRRRANLRPILCGCLGFFSLLLWIEHVFHAPIFFSFFSNIELSLQSIQKFNMYKVT